MTRNKLVNGLLERLLIKADASSFTLPGALGEEARILAIGSGDITDLIFHIPLLRTIRTRFPRSRTDFLLPDSDASLIVPSGLARECFIYDKGSLKIWNPAFYSLLKKIRRIGYDLCLVMSQEPQRALEMISLASGAGVRIGPSHAASYPAINLELRPQDPDAIYRGSRLEALAPFLGLPVFKGDRAWPLAEEKLRRVRQLIHFNKPRQEEILLGVDPALGKNGVGFTLQNLHFIINQISTQIPCRVVPLSLTDSESRVGEFIAGLDRAPLLLEAETRFDILVQASLCDLFLAGNTDLFHFTAAQKIPTLGMFMSEDGGNWIPDLSPNVQILRVAPGQRLDIDILMQAVEAARSTT